MKAKRNRFGTLLKRLRKQRGIGQKHLNDMVGCSLQTVSNWEAGRFFPDQNRLVAVVKALKLERSEGLDLISECVWEQMMRPWERMQPEVRKRLEQTREEGLNKQRVPLYRAGDTVHPHDVTWKRKRRWRGEFVFKTEDQESGFTFAFMIEDNSMMPRYNRGDILYCESINLPKEGKPVVACVNGRVFCRVYGKQGERLMFRPIKKGAGALVVDKKAVKWCYRVVRRVSWET